MEVHHLLPPSEAVPKVADDEEGEEAQNRVQDNELVPSSRDDDNLRGLQEPVTREGKAGHDRHARTLTHKQGVHRVEMHKRIEVPRAKERQTH